MAMQTYHCNMPGHNLCAKLSLRRSWINCRISTLTTQLQFFWRFQLSFSDIWIGFVDFYVAHHHDEVQKYTKDPQFFQACEPLTPSEQKFRYREGILLRYSSIDSVTAVTTKLKRATFLKTETMCTRCILFLSVRRKTGALISWFYSYFCHTSVFIGTHSATQSSILMSWLLSTLIAMWGHSQAGMHHAWVPQVVHCGLMPSFSSPHTISLVAAMLLLSSPCGPLYL